MKSEGKLKLASARLIGRYPLHGAILAQWRPVADESVGTMCVGFRGAAIELRFAPSFVEGLPLDELIGVLVHEVNHVLGGHVWMLSENYPDADAFVAATEITANEYIREPLPGTPLLLSDYPALPADEDAHRRYKKLESEAQESEGGARDEGDPQDGDGEDGEEEGADEGDSQDGNGEDGEEEDGSGGGQGWPPRQPRGLE